MEKIRTIFFGTPEFAVASLESLLANSRLEVVAVVTQPDRPVGRKKILTPPPVKVVAQKNGLKIFQPEKLGDERTQDEILSLQPELCVVVAYGKLIPKRLLSAVPRGFVNVHPSLLPKHRGAAPITAAILDGDDETGVCLMVLDAEMDHGPLIACRRLPIDNAETTESLRAKLTPIGVEMLNFELVEWLEGKIIPQPQNHEAATLCKQLESADAKINWSKPVVEIDRLVRAMHGVTPAWTALNGQTLLVHKASILNNSSFPRRRESNPNRSTNNDWVPAFAGTTVEPGAIFVTDKKMAVAAKDGYLVLDEVQPSGGKLMTGQAFLNGRKEIVGKIFF